MLGVVHDPFKAGHGPRARVRLAELMPRDVVEEAQQRPRRRERLDHTVALRVEHRQLGSLGEHFCAYGAARDLAGARAHPQRGERQEAGWSHQTVDA